MKFTPFKIDSLKPKDARYTLFEDSGLGIRVGTTARKTWVTMYRKDSKQRMMSHGRYPDIKLARARLLHTAAMKKVDEGKDPAPDLVAQREGERNAETFASLADEYLNHRDTKKKRSWREEKRNIENELLLQWGNRKLKDINRRDVVRLLDAIVDRGSPIMANRTKSLILTMFKFAVDRGLLDDLPFHYIRKPGGDEPERDRVLSDDEIRVFWTRLDDIDTMTPIFKTGLRVLLLTAARRGELVKARVSDIDDGIWSIPAEHSKNKYAHSIPLSDMAADLMAELVHNANEHESEYLLPSPIGGQTRRGQIHYTSTQSRSASV
jgi:integrase